ncbi:hypothetical protein [Nocardia cyriacigeorgica]|uniref:hypothetical protein n=1 Tax=Nocardia cyriacigeorgica TaxID=135487 RepID=UPI00189596D4|nr:hypothetical protein [Nocardia cyriacigeorgica]MBF6416986.1 hypothetical protein [Nocardia cyriacigeorgica]
MNRIDITPSLNWSAIPMSGRLVWAAAAGNKIATYWAYDPTDAPNGSGWTLIRTDVLPFDSDIIGGPPPYRARQAGLDGAIPFINGELFLWWLAVPAWGPGVGEPAPIGVEGEPPVMTLYPKNSELPPPV